MQINQVNISYHQSEDRLLMRINTLDGAELRLWLTRAVVARMLAGLAQSEKTLTTYLPPQIYAPSVARALEQFDQEATLLQSDFLTPFADNSTHYPLGQQPLLVVKLEIAGSEDRASFSFDLLSGQKVTIKLTVEMISNINKLLCDLLQRVDWNLPSSARKRPLVRLPESETLH